MSTTAGEFVASLTAAFPGAVAAGEGWAEIHRDGAGLRFEFTPVAPLTIGSLSLPRIELAIAVTAGDEAAAEELLTAVDRATQRGGG